MKNDMKQEVSDNSMAVQIAGDLNWGITYDNARNIALDVYKANFLELSEKAAQTAYKRVEELVYDFLENLYKEDPKVIDKLQEPAFQCTLFNAEREYAKTGDIELKENLLKLLIERICSEERSLKQIVLDEALELLPKLTQEQLNFASSLFMFHELTERLYDQKIFNISDFENNLAKVCTFPLNSKKLRIEFLGYLQYLGCILETSNYNYFGNIKRIIKEYSGTTELNMKERDLLRTVNPTIYYFYLLWEHAIRRQKRITKLTTVGLVIAIVNYNKQTNSNIIMEDYLSCPLYNKYKRQ